MSGENRLLTEWHRRGLGHVEVEGVSEDGGGKQTQKQSIKERNEKIIKKVKKKGIFVKGGMFHNCFHAEGPTRIDTVERRP